MAYRICVCTAQRTIVQIASGRFGEADIRAYARTMQALPEYGVFNQLHDLRLVTELDLELPQLAAWAAFVRDDPSPKLRAYVVPEHLPTQEMVDMFRVGSVRAIRATGLFFNIDEAIRWLGIDPEGLDCPETDEPVVYC